MFYDWFHYWAIQVHRLWLWTLTHPGHPISFFLELGLYSSSIVFPALFCRRNSNVIFWYWFFLVRCCLYLYLTVITQIICEINRLSTLYLTSLVFFIIITWQATMGLHRWDISHSTHSQLTVLLLVNTVILSKHRIQRTISSHIPHANLCKCTNVITMLTVVVTPPSSSMLIIIGNIIIILLILFCFLELCFIIFKIMKDIWKSF